MEQEHIPPVSPGALGRDLLRFHESLAALGRRASPRGARGPGGVPGGLPASGVVQDLTGEQLLGPHPIGGGPECWLACGDHSKPV